MSGRKACPDCSTWFQCGPCETCWCAQYPSITPLDEAQDCRCPECLAVVINRRIREFIATVPHAEALRRASNQPPAKRLIEHVDFTVEEGNYVFSSWYLLKQGACCGNGCRNCPYPGDAPTAD